jgi:hypothetical protein
MDKSQIARIFEFDLKVRGGWFPSRSSFATQNGVSERTVARDVEYIRERLGAPLEFHKERRGYYYSKPWNLPSILMAMFKTEEKIDYAINFLLEMKEEDRKTVIHAVIEVSEGSILPDEAPESDDCGDDFMVEYDFRDKQLTLPLEIAAT